MGLLHPDLTAADDACRDHGPCEPWCTEEDLCELSLVNDDCDTGSCRKLIEELNQQSGETIPDPDGGMVPDPDNPGETIPATIFVPGTAGSDLFLAKAHEASSMLYRLSGEIFPGVCCSKIYWCDGRLCCGWNINAGKTFRQGTRTGSPVYAYDPRIKNWTNCYPGDLPKGCNLGDRLRLPYGPVCDVKSVTLPATWDGITPLYILDPVTGLPELDDAGEPQPLVKPDGSAYLPGDNYPGVIPLSDLALVSAEDGSELCDLVFCDGRPWPCPPANVCADPPGLCVEWSYGYAPPPEGRTAACALACELMKACITGKCRLNERVTSTSRMGSSLTLLDPFQYLDKGRLGLGATDRFLAVWNPHGLTQPPTVFFATSDSCKTGRQPFNLRRIGR